MDLGAYAQIEDLDEIAQRNGIEVPRLRGYRLMADVETYTEKDTLDEIADIKASYRRMHQSLSELHQVSADVRRQHETWNKYAGRDDVLYIHTRDGYPSRELRDMPWFLDFAVDAFDGTYCDIYAKIEPVARREEDAVNTD